MSVGDFLQNQLLGMHWLNELLGRLLTLCGLDTAGRVGGSVQFFIFDTIKILILLSVLIFIISYIQSYFPPERTKRILSRFHGIWANSLAALLGTVTPFCSCSSIPLFIGFSSAGLPVGVTFSFLISSPLVDLGSLLLLTGIFGWKIAVAYVIVGLVLAVTGGTLIERLRMERYVEDFIREACCAEIAEQMLTRRERLTYSGEQVRATVKKVFWYMIVGVGIGAVIHNWIPTEWVQAVLGSKNPFSVVLAAAVGIPMYADIFGTIPIAEALYSKGVGIGTIVAFMMGVTALSLPSMIMLRRAIKPRLLGLFIGIVTLGIIIIGYLFNAFQFMFVQEMCGMKVFAKKKEESHGCCGNIDAASIAKAKAAQSGGAAVKILGSGCPKCNLLEANTVEALKKLGMDTAVEHVRDFAEIAAFGVMTTPALVYKNKVLAYGKVLKTDEIEALLKKED